MHGRRGPVDLLIDRGASLTVEAWENGPNPLDCAIWALRCNRAHDGDYVGTVAALALAGAGRGTGREPRPGGRRGAGGDTACGAEAGVGCDRAAARPWVDTLSAPPLARSVVTLSARMQLAAAKPTPSAICPAAGGSSRGIRLVPNPAREQEKRMSSDVIYTMYRADKFYGPERQVLSNISLSFLHGAKIGVLGPNGAGKSTLLRISMAGLEEPSSGVAELDPKATVGYLSQEPSSTPEGRPRQRRGRRPRVRDLLDRFNAISAAFAEPDADFDALLAEQADVQDKIERADAWSLDQTLDRAMDAPPPRRRPGRHDAPGGERRKVAPAACSSPHRPASLDEPTNHLDAESVAWLERHLEAYRGTVIAVTHDRYFLDNVAGGSSSSTAARDFPSRATTRPGSSRRRRGSGSRRSRTWPAAAPCSASSEWVRMSLTARHAKSKARLTAYEAPRRGPGEADRHGRDPHPAGPRLGDVVVRAEHVQKGFGDRLLMEDLIVRPSPWRDRRRDRAERRRQDDPLRMIAGEEQPDAGSLVVGETVELAYVDQSRSALDGQSTVWKEISGNQDVITLGKREVNSRQYVSWFNFRGGDQQKLVKDLSGGEEPRPPWESLPPVGRQPAALG